MEIDPKSRTNNYRTGNFPQIFLEQRKDFLPVNVNSSSKMLPSQQASWERAQCGGIRWAEITFLVFGGLGGKGQKPSFSEVTGQRNRGTCHFRHTRLSPRPLVTSLPAFPLGELTHSGRSAHRGGDGRGAEVKAGGEEGELLPGHGNRPKTPSPGAHAPLSSALSPNRW